MKWPGRAARAVPRGTRAEERTMNEVCRRGGHASHTGLCRTDRDSISLVILREMRRHALAEGAGILKGYLDAPILPTARSSL